MPSSKETSDRHGRRGRERELKSMTSSCVTPSTTSSGYTWLTKDRPTELPYVQKEKDRRDQFFDDFKKGGKWSDFEPPVRAPTAIGDPPRRYHKNSHERGPETESLSLAYFDSNTTNRSKSDDGKRATTSSCGSSYVRPLPSRPKPRDRGHDQYGSDDEHTLLSDLYSGDGLSAAADLRSDLTRSTGRRGPAAKGRNVKVYSDEDSDVSDDSSFDDHLVRASKPSRRDFDSLSDLSATTYRSHGSRRRDRDDRPRSDRPRYDREDGRSPRSPRTIPPDQPMLVSVRSSGNDRRRDQRR